MTFTGCLLGLYEMYACTARERKSHSCVDLFAPDSLEREGESEIVCVWVCVHMCVYLCVYVATLLTSDVFSPVATGVQ